MSIKHDFFLVPEDKSVNGGLMTWEDRDIIPPECKLVIDDEFIRYITDVFNWIPTYNPNKDEFGQGLNYWGNTVIDKLGCDKLKKILKGLKLIIECAPNKVNLKGSFYWEEDKEKGSYEELEFDKDKLLEDINKLVLFAEKVKKENYLIYHMGI